MERRGGAAEIAATGISKAYGNFFALKDVSLTIGRGEFLTLLGPSGSGKTTFLMTLAGFVEATAGRLVKDGVDITRQPAERRGFGMVFQGYALFPHMSVEKNIAFPLQVQGRSAAEIRTRVGQMIEKVGLTGHAHKRPADLSGGQQQRVAVARALAFEPSVLLLDEPFSALDKNLRGAMQEEMRRLHQDTGTTFVFVTHDQSEALALSTRVAIFNHGCLQQVASPRQVYDQPANRFVAEFLGDINILPVDGNGSDADGSFARHGGETIRLAAPAGQASASFAIRPEYVTLSVTPPAEANALPVSIRSMTYLGAVTRFATETSAGAPLVAELPTHQVPAGFAPGTVVRASWPRDRGYFL
nr:ABC transporter ATP-binding protein [uncultured Gellertiella sp.]